MGGGSKTFSQDFWSHWSFVEYCTNNGNSLYLCIFTVQFLYIFKYFVDMDLKKRNSLLSGKYKKHSTHNFGNQINDSSMLCSVLSNVLGTGSHVSFQITPPPPSGNLQSSTSSWWRRER